MPNVLCSSVRLPVCAYMHTYKQTHNHTNTCTNSCQYSATYINTLSFGFTVLLQLGWKNFVTVPWYGIPHSMPLHYLQPFLASYISFFVVFVIVVVVVIVCCHCLLVNTLKSNWKETGVEGEMKCIFQNKRMYKTERTPSGDLTFRRLNSFSVSWLVIDVWQFSLTMRIKQI